MKRKMLKKHTKTQTKENIQKYKKTPLEKHITWCIYGVGQLK